MSLLFAAILCLICSVVSLYRIVQSLRAKKISHYWVFIYSKDRSPIAFWAAMIIYLIFAILGIFIFFLILAVGNHT